MLGTIPQPTRRRTRIIAAYTPLPWQVAPWQDRSPVLLLTGSAGGGKSRLAAEKLHAVCLRYPGATALLLRKARVSITNSTAELLRRAVVGPDPRVTHVPSKSRFEYANGSLLIYAGLDGDDQRERLRSIGAEGGVDIAWMEEATEFDEADFNALTARMRGRAASWRQVLLSCNPDAPTHWIYRRLIVGGEACVYYSQAADNPHNPPDYHARLATLTGVDAARLAGGQWVQASGLVYGDQWLDGPAGGNVTADAEYAPGVGELVWALDDGYAGQRDAATGLYTADSHPRVILLAQVKPGGHLDIVAESYAVRTLPEAHIAEARTLPYPAPDWAVCDSSAAELRRRLMDADIPTRRGTHPVAEGIALTRAFLAPDANGWRRVRVHPRCKQLRAELASYRVGIDGAPIKQFDHGPDSLRYLCWARRYEE
jgi:phage terminase large subunit